MLVPKGALPTTQPPPLGGGGLRCLRWKRPENRWGFLPFVFSDEQVQALFLSPPPRATPPSPISYHHVRYYFDTDRITQTRFGERRSMLSLAQPGQTSGLVITSTMPTADHEVHLVEVRELIDGGMAHTQVRLRTAPFEPHDLVVAPPSWVHSKAVNLHRRLQASFVNLFYMHTYHRY